MLGRVYPPGWVASSQATPLTAKQLSAVRSNLVKALDGAGGGAYAPYPHELHFGGSGLGGTLVDTTQTGTATRDPVGHFPRRVSINHVVDTATAQILDLASDIYWVKPSAIPKTVAWNFHLSITLGVAPVAGSELLFVCSELPVGALRIYDELGNGLAVYPSAYTHQQSGSPLWSKFYFDGAAWQKLEFSADVTT